MSSLNDRPRLTPNAEVSVNQGAEVIITSAQLQISDSDTLPEHTQPEQLIYTLTRLPASGTLRLNNRALAINNTFTQADVNRGEITYLNQGNLAIDRFDFSVSNGNQISRITVDANGNQTRGDFQFIAELTTPGLSADGRFATYASYAGDLVADDTNHTRDIFVFDRETLQTTRVSIASDGTQSNSLSESPSISADGRYVAFWSNANNLVENDTNNVADTFVHDRQTGETTRISIDSTGIQGNAGSYGTTISADGRYVTYSSFASNLVSADTNGERDVFVFDRQTQQTTRVSIDSEGNQGNGLSRFPAISGNGRYVAFHSSADNLASGDTNRHFDVFVFDRQTQQTSAVSLSSQGTFGDRDSFDPMLSADGRFVVFESEASNLAVGDTNNKVDIFVHDRQTGKTTSVSSRADVGNGNSYDAAISADARYITFASDASNLVAGDTNDRTDIFRYDRQTETLTRISENSTSANGGSYAPIIAPDGQSIVFYSTANNLVSDDTNGGIDLFVASSRRSSGSATIAIRLNQAPTLKQAIADQIATVGTTLRFTLPAQTFQDADAGETVPEARDRLTLTATRSDGGALPNWLRFDATTGEFTGTPLQAESIALKVTATDLANAAVSDEFELAIVAPPNSTPTSSAPTNSVPTNSDPAKPHPLSGQAGVPPLTRFGKITRRINGTPKADRLTGGRTHDLINGFGRNDRISSRSGDDRVQGGKGNDRINGGSGNDRLNGSQGNDRLIGGRGDDRLVGGQGQDLLTGGAGQDLFVFTHPTGAQVDRILDFDQGNDWIDLRSISAKIDQGASLAQTIRLEQVGADTEIQIDLDGSGSGTAFAAIARLQNISATTLTARNFAII